MGDRRDHQDVPTISTTARSAIRDDAERQHVVRVISGDAYQQDAISSHGEHGGVSAASSSDAPATSDSDNAKAEEEGAASRQSKKKPAPAWRRWGNAVQAKLPPELAWVAPTVSSWPKMKPVLRSGLAAWICMLFLLISPVERIALGQASFLILVGIFITPVEAPFIAVVEREFFTLLLTCAAWAYSCFAIFLAHLARNRRVPQSETNILAALDGEYIELAPSAICGLFLAVGVAFFLYLKVKFGPSPFLFATILACITLDITLTYAPLYPFPFYLLGRTVIVPLAIKTGIAIVVSLVVFPKSVNSTFVERLQAVIKPLQDASSGLADMMQRSPLDDDFDFELVRNLVAKSEGGLVPLLGSARLLTREVSFSLASGESLKSLVKHTRALLAPVDGVAFYFSIIRGDLRGLDTAHHPHASHFATPAPSRPSTPLPSRPSSRPPSRRGSPRPGHGTPDTDAEKGTAHMDEKQSAHTHSTDRPGMRKRFSSSRLQSPTPRKSGQHKHSKDLFHKLHDALHAQRRHAPIDIGLWESLRYNAIESFLHNRNHERHTETCLRILADMSRDLLKAQAASYGDLLAWMQAINSQRSKKLRDVLLLRSTKTHPSLLSNADGTPRTMDDAAQHLQNALRVFEQSKMQILEPFRSSVEDVDEGAGNENIPHRYLFQSLTFCYFQVEYTQRLVALLKACDKLESDDRKWRLWLPNSPKVFRAETWWTHDEHSEDLGNDENPDEVPGMASSLGQTQARDPDALESDSAWHSIGVAVSVRLHQLYRGHSLFMIKVGIVTILVALPSLYKASAGWAYQNRAIWPLIMSQLVTARHRGEVLFGLISRAVATFAGAAIGLVIWYIAAGDGRGNPYAMAVVTAIAFPIVMLGRIHYPGPPITPIITCVTVALVVGYSWQDSHNPGPGSPGVGWPVAWRRFVEVLIGAAASYVMAVLPPSSNLRTYFRVSHATTIREAGGLFCTAVTIASSPSHKHDIPDVQAQLLAVRNKIRRLGHLKGPIAYEWSLRGKWPLRRYAELEHVELRILRLLTHTTTIYERLGPAYSRALLSRTHFLDPLFLADCIAVLSMCATSLRTRQPLPQIVPVLIDRYLSTAWGFKVSQHRTKQQQLGADDIDGLAATDDPGFGEKPKDLFADLPETVTFETLCDPQYQVFAVGAQIAFGLVLHMDRLCVAVKALVGETYAVPADLEQYQYLNLLQK